MLKDTIKPVFTKFFKEHFMVDVIVEEVPSINPVFMVKTYDGKKEKHLLIIYVNDRVGNLPILNIYHYDGDGETYLREMIIKAKRHHEHYKNIHDIFGRIHEKLGVFKIHKITPEKNILNLFTTNRVNSVNDFNKLSGRHITEFKSILGISSIRHDVVFTIYDDELYLDLQLTYSISYTDKIISSHPQLLANRPTYYDDVEKEVYQLSRVSIITKIRQNLKIILNSKEVLDEDLIRYVQLLEMTKI